MGKTKLGLYVIVLVVVALVVTASLILAYAKANAPTVENENVLAVTDARSSVYLVVELLDSVTSEFSTHFQEGESVLDLLYRLHNEDKDFTFSVENSDFGPFITKVNGYEASNERREVWKLIINGMNIQGGIETLTVAPGDVLALELERY